MRKCAPDERGFLRRAALPRFAPTAAPASVGKAGLLARGGGAEFSRAEATGALKDRRKTDDWSLAYKADSRVWNWNKIKGKTFTTFQNTAADSANFTTPTRRKREKVPVVLANFQLEQNGSEFARD